MSATERERELLDRLNPQQREAASHVEGPLLIIAGAGSGKTRVITHHIAYLVDVVGVRPEQILAVTFTNKAAQEMRERVRNLLAGPRRTGDPLISTFHSLCVRILRRDIERLGEGLTRNFTIYDADDSAKLVKQCMADLHIDERMAPVRAIHSAISSAKNRGIVAEEYASRGGGTGPGAEQRREAIARVFKLYEHRKTVANALDFDDLLLKTVVLLRRDAETRAYYNDRFRHIMVDEYQDTNQPQFALVRLLTEKTQNLVVVGDDDQCVPAGLPVLTDEGERSIEEVRAGDRVLACAGRGSSTFGAVQRVRKRQYIGEVVRVTLADGRELRLTPNHMCFARLGVPENAHYVCLMYREDKGYRIGIAKGARSDGRRPELQNGLRVRVNGEHADKVWVLNVCRSRDEAAYFEQWYAVEYGIPTLVFHVAGRAMAHFSQEYVDRLYREIDTHARAAKLMRDLELSADHPHYRPNGFSRGGRQRVTVHFTAFGGNAPSAQAPWFRHRVWLNTSDRVLESQVLHGGIATRPGNRETWRVERAYKEMGRTARTADEIARSAGGAEVARWAALTRGEKFAFQPASHLRPTMIVPVWRDGEFVDEEIVDVAREDYFGNVYDLDVAEFHNYTVSGVAVHNSIYAWRGADITNILSFERQYPGAKVVRLEQNYRSTQNILDAAGAVIKNNRARKGKSLWTEHGSGDKITYYQAVDAEDEARWVIGRAGDLVRRDPKARVAVLYRMNAQSRSFEEACRRAGIAYNIVGGFSFYERAEIKDTIAYLKLALNPNDPIAFGRVINTPRRGIGKTTLDAIDRHVRDLDVGLWEALAIIVDQKLLPPRPLSAVAGFKDTIERLAVKAHELGLAEVVHAAVRDTGLEDALKQEQSEEAEGRLLNLEELVNAAAESEEEGITLREFIDHAALTSDTDQYTGEAQVTLMTMHSAKGLEFPLVFVVGLEEGLMPHSRSAEDPAQMEEERRLLYVAITRAERSLAVSHAMRRRLYGNEVPSEPSRFLNELPVELLEDASHGPSWLSFAASPATRHNRAAVDALTRDRSPRRTSNYSGKTYDSADAIRDFFAKKGITPPASTPPAAPPRGPAPRQAPDRSVSPGGLVPGVNVRHPKYGEGLLLRKEGTGDDAKLTVSFPGYGQKKFVARFAQLERV